MYRSMINNQSMWCVHKQISIYKWGFMQVHKAWHFIAWVEEIRNNKTADAFIFRFIRLLEWAWQRFIFPLKWRHCHSKTSVSKKRRTVLISKFFWFLMKWSERDRLDIGVIQRWAFCTVIHVFASHNPPVRRNEVLFLGMHQLNIIMFTFQHDLLNIFKCKTEFRVERFVELRNNVPEFPQVVCRLNLVQISAKIFILTL